MYIMSDDIIIRKKVRGSNRISSIKIKRVRGETILSLKICDPIVELLKGATCEGSETMKDKNGNFVKVYNRTDRWKEIIKFFSEFANKDNFHVFDTNDRPLIDFTGGSNPYISIYLLRLTDLDKGVDVKIPEMITIAGLETWADKINKLLSVFYRNFIEKVEIEATLRKPVI